MYFDVQSTDQGDGSVKLLDHKGKTIASCRKEKFGPGKIANIIVKNGWTKKQEGECGVKNVFELKKNSCFRPGHDSCNSVSRTKIIWKLLQDISSQCKVHVQNTNHQKCKMLIKF